ncbi:minor capsid protein [Inquilinus sp.]|uniref:minor capsid protein n=1 Tax=Inquilinus sp. TaxID=1932117 RepID=UPI0031D1EB15
MAYDLVGMVRRGRTRRRSVAAKAVVPTQARVDALAAIYLEVPRGWLAQVRGRVLPAYGTLRDRLVRDDEQDQLEAALIAAAALMTGLTAQLRPRMAQWLAEFDTWHARRFAQTIAAAAGIDPLPMMSALEAAPARGLALQRNLALLRSLDDQVRGSVERRVWVAVAQREPVTSVSRALRDAIGTGRRRALNLARAQTDTIASEFDEVRRGEAGLDRFRWRHSGNPNPRHWHKARDGKVYRTRDIPAGDRPGIPPFCDCKGEPWIGLED